MLTYSFAGRQNEPLYEYLYRRIKEDIMSGEIPVGERLPSKRALARQLGVSTITIEGAYGQLAAEGYVQSIPKRGYFVADMRSTAVPSPDIREENICFTEAKPKYFADFTANNVTASDFPLRTWSRLQRDCIKEKADALLERTSVHGATALREAIALHLKQFRGLVVSPEQIIIGAGTEYLYSMLVQLLGREKIFCTEDPGYGKIRRIYEANGARCLSVAMDESGIQVRQIEACGADVVHISPSHQFPTGIVMPAHRRYELLAWASKGKRYIIEDDYDSEFRLTEKPLPTLMGIDASDTVIYMNTFSKSLAATIRISYMVLPLSLLEAFEEKLGFYSSPVSSFEQYTLAKFMQEGFFEKHINRMRNRYRRRRDSLLAAIKQSTWQDNVQIMEESAGLHFMLKFQTTLSDRELKERLQQQGIALRALKEYYLQPAPEAEHVFVMNYSHIREEIMKEAINRIGRALNGA